MREPDDLNLRTTVHALVSLTAGEAVHLIDTNYEVRYTFLLTEFGMAQATKARAQMLSDHTLVAVVMTGWAGQDEVITVCEHYTGPGQIETYTLSTPLPRPVWSDPDDPDCKDAITATKDIWKIDRL